MSVATRVTTALGTPRAETWDDDWFALVEQVEERLGHRICGAHAPDNEPCELQSTHVNGRCRFHGGHPRIGAQPGNTNALIHGLYSRRIRTCESTCPIWDRCPMAGKDVLQLAPNKRPQCVYERAAFDAFRGLNGETFAPEWEGERPREPWLHGARDSRLRGNDIGRSDRVSCHSRAGGNLIRTETSACDNDPRPVSPGHRWDAATFRRVRLQRRVNRKRNRGETAPLFSPYIPPKPGSEPVGARLRNPDKGAAHRPFRRRKATAREDTRPPANPVRDTAALLYAMVQRAAIHVAAHELTDHTYAGGEKYTLSTKKISPGVNALLYIARELRAWIRLR